MLPELQPSHCTGDDDSGGDGPARAGEAHTTQMDTFTATTGACDTPSNGGDDNEVAADADPTHITERTQIRITDGNK